MPSNSSRVQPACVATASAIASHSAQRSSVSSRIALVSIENGSARRATALATAAQLQTRPARPSRLSHAGSGQRALAWYFLCEWQWMMESLLLLANWPFTMLIVMPANRRLMVLQPQHVGAESRGLLLRWGKQQADRSALGSTASLLFAWGPLIARKVWLPSHPTLASARVT